MTTKLTTQMGGMTGGMGSGLYSNIPETGQQTVYHIMDDGDLRSGKPQSYTVLSNGQYSGTSNIDVPHYAANTISFTAPNTISDAAAGLVTILATDTIRVRGSGLNDGVYTVLAGGVAGSFTTVENTIVNEAAGAYVTLCKRSTPSNNCVLDNNTRLMWKRAKTDTTGAVERHGNTSNGSMSYYDTATCYTLHPAAADLQMMTTGIKIVGGAGEIARYFVGMVIDPSGFANAVNNLPGYVITAVTVNGADLDLTLKTGNQTLIAEAAGGARDIRVVCRSIFGYAAAANAVSYAGFTDWRIPNIVELLMLAVQNALQCQPNAVAFPNWPNNSYAWSCQYAPAVAANGIYLYYRDASTPVIAKTTQLPVVLVRGGL